MIIFFRFLLIKTGDLLYIKTEDKDVIHVARVKSNSNISFDKTYSNKQGETYDVYVLDNVEFSNPIKKNVLCEQCDTLLSEKYPNEKDILLDFKAKINYLNGTCLHAFNGDKHLRLKEVFYEALNFHTNQEVGQRVDLEENIIKTIKEYEKLGMDGFIEKYNKDGYKFYPPKVNYIVYNNIRYPMRMIYRVSCQQKIIYDSVSDIISKIKQLNSETLRIETNPEQYTANKKMDLRCEKMMDIIVNHICNNNHDDKIIPIVYEQLAELLNADKLPFDNHLIFNPHTPAKNSKQTSDGETSLSLLLNEIYYKCGNIGIPHLNYLVVNKTGQNKGKCGEGVNSFGLNETEERLKIWQYDWNSWRHIKDTVKTIDKIEASPEKKEYIAEQWIRDSRVRRKVIDNANGICQGCQKKSFEKENGEIYLEVHHKVYLSQNGLDTVENCVALCPNCHKNEHFGKIDSRKFTNNR